MIDNEIMVRVLEFARRSPDPSTQNAAVIGARPNLMYEETFSVNEFPRYIRYLPERWERPIKYEYIEHAERNAIYAAAKHGFKTQNCTMWCAWAACSDCARAIIQAGISKLVTLAPERVLTNERWDTSVNVGMEMLNEGGVEITYLKKPIGLGFTLMRNGKELTFYRENNESINTN